MARTATDGLELSQTEWRAVTVALRDAEHFGTAVARQVGQPEGGIARALRWLTGIEAPRPLADPRLDALRRFVWAARRRSARVRDMVPELMDFGYSPTQIEAIRLVAG